MSQSKKTIFGKITDKKTGDELLYLNIVLFKNGVFATGGSTDFEGNYSISLDPGIYEMKLSYTGYPDRIITDIIIPSKKELVELNIQMTPGNNILNLIVTSVNIPMLDQEPSSRGKLIYQEEIKNQPQKTINQLLLNTPGVSLSNFKK